MTRTASHAGEPDRARAPFAGLVAELGELGFEPQPVPGQPGHTVYAATDSLVRITAVTDPTGPHVCVAASTGGQAWHVHWTAATPVHVQLAALYAVLNDDPAVALDAAAASLGVPPPAEDRKHYPAG